MSSCIVIKSRFPSCIHIYVQFMSLYIGCNLSWVMCLLREPIMSRFAVFHLLRLSVSCAIFYVIFHVFMFWQRYGRELRIACVDILLCFRNKHFINFGFSTSFLKDPISICNMHLKVKNIIRNLCISTCHFLLFCWWTTVILSRSNAFLLVWV